MHVVFLTRKFPPQKGGMETFSYQLTQHIPCQRTVFAYGKRQIDIVWVAPVLFIKSLFLFRQADLFHIGDAVLAPVGALVKAFTSKPVVVTIHGLELSYNKWGWLYKWIMRTSLFYIDAFVCVSRHTSLLLQQWGVPEEKIRVITHGVVEPQRIDHEVARKELAQLIGMDEAELRERFVLLSVGRLVRRKGVAWFIENVMPNVLHMHPLLLIASTGPEETRIRQLVHTYHLESQVRLLGKVSDIDLAILYSSSDVFVMPNIPLTHDVEGFGFVAIEAASYGLPVIASALEGIPDAIHHRKNGLLVEPENAGEFARVINECYQFPKDRVNFGAAARVYTLQHFQWKDVAEQYLALFKTISRFT